MSQTHLQASDVVLIIITCKKHLYVEFMRLFSEHCCIRHRLYIRWHQHLPQWLRNSHSIINTCLHSVLFFSVHSLTFLLDNGPVLQLMCNIVETQWFRGVLISITTMCYAKIVIIYCQIL